MLVYDVTSEKSFENIKTWIRNIEQHASDDVEKMILGNKCDMEDKRVVTKEQGQKVRYFVNRLFSFNRLDACKLRHFLIDVLAARG